jgi:hypothetical protein
MRASKSSRIVTLDQLDSPDDLLASAWSLYKGHWKFLSLMAIFPSLLVSLGNILIVLQNSVVKGVAFFILALGLVLSLVLQPALINSIHRFSTDPLASLSIKNQYKFGLSYLGPLVVAIVLQVFIVAGASVFLIIPAIVTAIYTVMYFFNIVLGGERGLGALVSSYALVIGRWWSVFWRVIFIVIVSILIYAVIAALVYVAELPLQFSDDPVTQGVVNLLFRVILAAIVVPLPTAYMYQLFISLRSTRQEGVKTKDFRLWLIVSACIGVVVLSATIITATLMFLSGELTLAQLPFL